MVTTCVLEGMARSILARSLKASIPFNVSDHPSSLTYSSTLLLLPLGRPLVSTLDRIDRPAPHTLGLRSSFGTSAYVPTYVRAATLARPSSRGTREIEQASGRRPIDLHPLISTHSPRGSWMSTESDRSSRLTSAPSHPHSPS